MCRGHVCDPDKIARVIRCEEEGTETGTSSSRIVGCIRSLENLRRL
jgi:hypothetical protein